MYINLKKLFHAMDGFYLFLNGATADILDTLYQNLDNICHLNVHAC